MKEQCLSSQKKENTLTVYLKFTYNFYDIWEDGLRLKIPIQNPQTWICFANITYQKVMIVGSRGIISFCSVLSFKNYCDFKNYCFILYIGNLFYTSLERFDLSSSFWVILLFFLSWNYSNHIYVFSFLVQISP